MCKWAGCGAGVEIKLEPGAHKCAPRAATLPIGRGGSYTECILGRDGLLTEFPDWVGGMIVGRIALAGRTNSAGRDIIGIEFAISKRIIY